jgi:hypothetical protein
MEVKEKEKLHFQERETLINYKVCVLSNSQLRITVRVKLTDLNQE